MKFVKFTENNDNEGESWNFWLQLDDNQNELNKLQMYVSRFDPNRESFELNMLPVDESEVDVLVKHTGQGYMDYENKITGYLALPEIDDEIDEDGGYDWLMNNFYKGDIEQFFTNEKPETPQDNSDQDG